MNVQKYLIAFILVTFVFTASSWGHGIKLTVTEQYPQIIVKTKYHAGRDLAGAKVTVFFESEAKPFQEGKTDQTGDFSFTPKKPGKWKIIVDDQTGHRIEKIIDVTNDFLEEPIGLITGLPLSVLKKQQEENLKALAKRKKKDAEEAAAREEWLGYMLKIGLGVLLILGITFLMNKLKKKQEAQELQEIQDKK